MSADPNSLTTIATAANEFEAGTMVNVLKEAGIDAVAFDTASMGVGLLAGSMGAVPVQVRQADVERAREVLQRNVADSVDLDWDEVELGRPEDPGGPMTPTMKMTLRVVMVALVLIVVVVVAKLARLLVQPP